MLAACASRASAATFIVTITNDSGAGSLRQAILDANASADPDVIVFNIAPGGLQTIAPASALPDLTQPVTLDATTQPGFAGRPIIELNGIGAGANGLRILASGCTVRGLVINRVPGDGILLIGGGSIIAGNFIGTDASGTVAQANNGRGVKIEGSSNNRIGGTTTADRNVISGNFTAGVEIFRDEFAGGPIPSGNVILGNFIGADATGTTNVFNGGNGINLLGASDTVVGGTAPGAGNLIRGIFQGILLGNSRRTTGTRIEGNQILHNSFGLSFAGLAQNNLVGGTAPGAGNVIAFQTSQGIAIGGFGVTNNAIRGNSIHSNGQQGGQLGIDLAFDGVTLNDAGDADTGDNWRQNFPVLNTATGTATAVTVNGTLNSLPDRNYFLDFFSSSRRHVTGYGEGEKYLGSTTVLTDGSGNVSFTANLAATLLGRHVTATATDDTGNSSEFGLAITAVSTAPGQTFTVINTNNNGAGSLRDAIEQANAVITSGDLIRFNIPGSGPFTIYPSPPLPEIADPLAVDGTTQPGYTGTPLIELSGASAGIGVTADGLRITAGGSAVRGLALNRFASDGIELIGAGNNRIENCYLGLNPSGTNAPGNTSRGLFINNSPDNVISGNVISGNRTHGIEMTGTNATNNAVFGNVIGLGVNGADLGNVQQGLQINSAANVIGGTTAVARNVIAGNNGNGISFPAAGASNNLVQGNLIGLDANLDARANSGSGVTISGASRNTVGGSAPGAANTIAFNGFDGVFVNSGNRNAILNNSIFLNGDLGVDLGATGVTANDAGDGDSGANNLQNFPLITAATNAEGVTIIVGTLNSQANSNYTVQFFFSDACDPTGNGEGQNFLGTTSVTADGSGNAAFNVTIPTTTPGRFVTASATDAAGNTSEFGPCATAVNLISSGAFIVNTTANDGPGSLRQAILDSNARVTAGDRITFNIAGQARTTSVSPHRCRRSRMPSSSTAGRSPAPARTRSLRAALATTPRRKFALAAAVSARSRMACG